MSDQPAGEALLPCPFCGGPAVSYKWHDGNSLFIGCKSTACSISTSIVASADHAIAAWNRRPAAPAPAALREARSTVEEWIRDPGEQMWGRREEALLTLLAATSGDEQSAQSQSQGQSGPALGKIKE